MAKQKVLTGRLPATPCTPEMLARVREIADKQGRSIAEIQRDAISLFLRRYDRKTVMSDKILINQPIKES